MQVHGKCIYTGEYTWEEVTFIGNDWMQLLEISDATWARRLRIYGEADWRTFASKDDMRKYVIQTKKDAAASPKKKLTKLEEYRVPKKDSDEGPDRQQVKAMVNFITFVIEDAKKNVLLGNENTESSVRFLCNVNGQLQYFLEVLPGVDDVESALSALKDFAENGVRREQEKRQREREKRKLESELRRRRIMFLSSMQQ